MAQGMKIGAADVFAQSNPALCAICVHWLCVGYERRAQKATSSRAPSHLLPIWAMLGLALLIPSRVREQLRERPNAKLSKLFDEHPEWRAFACDAIRGIVDSFW